MGGVVLDFTSGAAPCADPAPSSAGVLLGAAVGGSAGPWSLTRLGWLYLLAVAAVTALGVWAATAAGVGRALLVVPALVPLAGPDFSRFFLSTYGEPAGLLGTYALCVGAAAITGTGPSHRAARGAALLLVAGGGLLAATAKTAYAPVMLVAVLVCAATAVTTRGGRRWSRHVIGPAVAVAVVGAAVLPVGAAQQWQARNYAGVNTHNLVYTLLLPEVGPEAAAMVGLPPAASSGAGRSYYPDGPAGVPGADVVAADPDGIRTAAWKTLATHPAALLRAVGVALQSTQGRDLDYLPRERWTEDTPRPTAVAPVGEQGATAGNLRGWLGGMRLPWWPSLLTALGIAAGLASVRIRPEGARALARTAGLAASTALGVAAVAVLGDGYFEVAKHTWLAAYLLDVTALSLAGAVLAGVPTLARRTGAWRTGR